MSGNYNNRTTNGINTQPGKRVGDFKAPQSKKMIPGDKAAEKVEEIEKIKKTRLKLDEQSLLYSENGIKKFYEILEKTEFKEKSSDVQNLNKLIMLFKNWHFMCFPKYNIDFFISKINDIGKKPSARAYMSRLRKIYKGEESWDVIYNEQNGIFNVPENKPEAAQSIPPKNKNFSEDTRIKVNVENTHNNLNSMAERINKVEISNREESEMQDFQFEEIMPEEDYPEINEKDFDNFDHNHNDDRSNFDLDLGTSFNRVKVNDEKSETNSFYKREKRLYSDAFNKNDSVSIDNYSVTSEIGGIISKKKKLN